MLVVRRGYRSAHYATLRATVFGFAKSLALSSIYLQANKNTLDKPRCFYWSGRQDLNLRPRGPKPRALPDCATPRRHNAATVSVCPNELRSFSQTTTLAHCSFQNLKQSTLLLGLRFWLSANIA